jgi:hypothetical protein
MNATCPQHPNMFATQRNHQISPKVLITDQRSPMIRRLRITTLTQYRARQLIGAIAHASGGARAGHPHQITQTALPQLLSEQRSSHHRSSAIETAYERDVQPRATHNPYRFPSSAARSSGSSKTKCAKVRNSAPKRFELRTLAASPSVGMRTSLHMPEVLGVTDTTTHSFRKTIATLVDDEGLSARIGADHLGNSHVSMTQDR